MAVYVDGAQNNYGRMIMCHMIADTAAELHTMAERIGVARRWYQSPAMLTVSFPHYDICKAKRALAVKNGAVELDRRQVGAHIRSIKQNIIGQGKKWSDTDWIK